MNSAGYSSSRAGAEGDLLAVFNADDRAVEMPLPQASRGECWRVLVDTGQAAGVPEPAILRCKEILRIEARGTVLLESDASSG